MSGVYFPCLTADRGIVKKKIYNRDAHCCPIRVLWQINYSELFSSVLSLESTISRQILVTIDRY